MTDLDKQRLMEAASILRSESRNYYDAYKRLEDATSNRATLERGKLYERYRELSRLANEIDIVAEGL